MSTKRLGWTIRPWQLGDHPSTRSLSEPCFRLVCSYGAQTTSVRPARQEGEHYRPTQSNSQLLRKSSPLLLEHLRHAGSDLDIPTFRDMLVVQGHSGGLVPQTGLQLFDGCASVGSLDSPEVAKVVR